LSIIFGNKTKIKDKKPIRNKTNNIATRLDKAKKKKKAVSHSRKL
jgi:hypothetical protein